MRTMRRLAMALLIAALPIALSPVRTAAAAVVSVTVGPPPLPVYVQPPIPAPGYVWVPGYWAWAPTGYYWVPGTWVLPPAIGVLWTPGWWEFVDGVYVWRPGYWAPEVGYYGGIDYGFGYTGYGFDGCYWRGGTLFYNVAVINIRHVRIVHVYNRTVINDPHATRVSFHGGPGGTMIQATAQQRAAASGRHVAPTRDQLRQQQLAQSNRMSFAAQNHGQPTVAATPRPGAFNGAGVVHARSAPPAGQQTPRTAEPSQSNREPPAAAQVNRGPAGPPPQARRQEAMPPSPRTVEPSQTNREPAAPPQANRGPAEPPPQVPRQQEVMPPRPPNGGPDRGPPATPNAQRPFQPAPGAPAAAPDRAPRVQQAMPPGGWTRPMPTGEPPRGGAPAAMPARPSGGAPAHPGGAAPSHPSGGEAPERHQPGQ